MAPLYIAGYDGSPAAEAALSFAERLAADVGADVVAVTVHEVARWSGRGALAIADDALRQEIQAAQGAPEGSVRPGIRTITVGATSAAQGLHLLAEEERAALVVVGATHRGTLGRIAPGSVGERLLHGAPCPVAVVPARPVGPIERIAVAYDGGAEADHALEVATAIAKATRASVVLLGVAEPSEHASAQRFEEEWRRMTEKHSEDLRRAQSRVEEAGVEARHDLRVGIVEEQLAAACAEHGAGLLVAGSRGYGPLRAVLAGCVSRHLADHAPCPVIIVPRGARTDVAQAPAVA